MEINFHYAFRDIAGTASNIHVEVKMKFVCLNGMQEDQEILKKEYKGAKRLGEVRLGENRLFYRYFIKIRYVSYTEIRRAYLREESGESGEFLLKEFYLMLETADGVLHKLRMEREVNAREVLACLQEDHESVKIGFDRSGQAKRKP